MLSALLAIIAIATTCNEQSTCESCVATTSLFKPCRWCPRDGTCHTPGAVLANPCGAQENIVSKLDPNGCQCASLFSDIITRRNELKKRISDLKQDKNKLPATGPNSVAGHIQQLQDKQTNLRNMLNQANTKGCKQDVADAWNYATSKSPVKLPEVAQKNGVTVAQLEKLAVALGVSVTVIAAAFFVPEMAAAGLLASFVARFA